MPGVGFELTIPAFERAKKVYALDGSATVIDFFANNKVNNHNNEEEQIHYFKDVVLQFLLT
jgi:hypothetical protein